MFTSGSNTYITTQIVVPTVGICQKTAAQVTARFKDNSDLAYLWTQGDNNIIRNYNSYPISPSGSECTGLVEPPHLVFFWTLSNK